MKLWENQCSHTLMKGMQIGVTPLEGNAKESTHLHMYLPFDLTSPLLGIYAEGTFPTI